MREAVSLDDRLQQAIERLAHARRAHLQVAATRLGLSPLQLELLALVDREPPPAHRAGELARELDVAPATVADALAALRRKHLIAERVDPADRRRKLVVPTQPGRELAATLRTDRERFGASLAELAEQDKAAALDVLLQLIARLFRDGVISVDRSCRTCSHYRRRGGPAGYCALLETPLERASLRVDCPEHEPAAA